MVAVARSAPTLHGEGASVCGNSGRDPPPTLSSGSQALSCPISASSFSTLPRLIFTLAICSDQAVLNNSGATCRVCFCCSNATPRTLAPSNTRLTTRNNEPAPLGKTHAFHSRPLKHQSSRNSSWNVASLRDRDRDKARKICICSMHGSHSRPSADKKVRWDRSLLGTQA